jgi:hypothetical protein
VKTLQEIHMTWQSPCNCKNYTETKKLGLPLAYFGDARGIKSPPPPPPIFLLSKNIFFGLLSQRKANNKNRNILKIIMLVV